MAFSLEKTCERDYSQKTEEEITRDRRKAFTTTGAILLSVCGCLCIIFVIIPERKKWKKPEDINGGLVEIPEIIPINQAEEVIPIENNSPPRVPTALEKMIQARPPEFLAARPEASFPLRQPSHPMEPGQGIPMFPLQPSAYSPNIPEPVPDQVSPYPLPPENENEPNEEVPEGENPPGLPEPEP